MPDINLTTVVTSIIVLMLLAVPFVAARLPHSRHSSRQFSSREANKTGPGPGFTYALVPPGGHPDNGNGDEQGSWQWCLAFVPEETSDGGSEMPPWWAPAPPWDTGDDRSQDFTRDADALQAVIEETSAYPAAR